MTERNYFKWVAGSVAFGNLRHDFVFFDADDAAMASRSYLEARCVAPSGAVISVYSHTPGVPVDVPLIGSLDRPRRVTWRHVLEVNEEPLG